MKALENLFTKSGTAEEKSSYGLFIKNNLNKIDSRLKFEQIASEDEKLHKTAALVEIPLLMKFANHLIEEGRPLQENVVTLLNCLFNSVKILTVNADKLEKDDSYTKTKWWPVLI